MAQCLAAQHPNQPSIPHKSRGGSSRDRSTHCDRCAQSNGTRSTSRNTAAIFSWHWNQRAESRRCSNRPAATRLHPPQRIVQARRCWRQHRSARCDRLECRILAQKASGQPEACVKEPATRCMSSYHYRVQRSTPCAHPLRRGKYCSATVFGKYVSANVFASTTSPALRPLRALPQHPLRSSP